MPKQSRLPPTDSFDKALSAMLEAFPDATFRFVLSNGENAIPQEMINLNTDSASFTDVDGDFRLIRYEHIVEVRCEMPIGNQVGERHPADF
jgi:hypothetical protein